MRSEPAVPSPPDVDALRGVLAETYDLQTAVDLTMDHLLGQGMPMPSLYLARGQRLRCMAQRGYWQVQDGLPIDVGVAGNTYRSGKSIRVLAADAPEFIAAVPGIAEEVCVPIRVDDEVVGVLNVESLDLLADDALTIVEACAELFGQRLADLGGPPSESPADQLVRHATRVAALTHTDELWQYAVTASCDIAGMSAAAIIDLSRPDGGQVVASAGAIGERLRQVRPPDWTTIAGQVSYGTSCHTSGSHEGAAFVGYQSLRDAGAATLIILPVFADGECRALQICADHTPAPPDTLKLERLELFAAQLGSCLQTLGALDELRDRTMQDPLTGLGNRTWFLSKVAERLESWRGTRTSQFTVMFCDLDGFKDVNDSLGHAAGDRLLVTVADRMRARLAPGDLLARVGGDEFAYCSDRFPTLQSAVHRASSLPGILARYVELDGVEVSISGSVGIAVADHTGPPPDALTLLREADAAMYEAKRRGRSRVALFTEDLRSGAADRLATAAGLRRAAAEHQLLLLYQPIVNLPSGYTVGTEALLRWQHPDRGLLTPEDFISIAEDTGTILEIGAWVLNEGCAQLARWDASAEVPAGMRLGINLSARQLLDPALPDNVRDAVANSGITADRLILEITESTLMEDVSSTQSILATMQELGVRIAVDDFGTGFSSLAYLKRFPVDILKIDASFIHELTSDTDVSAIVAAIIGMAKALGLDLVAEGVETAEQRDSLTALGCPNAQGFLFSPPRLAAELFNR